MESHEQSKITDFKNIENIGNGTKLERVLKTKCGCGCGPPPQQLQMSLQLQVPAPHHHHHLVPLFHQNP